MGNSTEIYWVNLQLKRGDHRVFLAIYESERQVLYRFVKKFIREDDVVYDILHDAFSSLWQARHRLSCRYPVESYLFRITRNLVYQTLRKRANSVVIAMEVDAETYHYCTHTTTEAYYIDKEYSAMLKDAVDALPPQRRRIFKLAREEGNTYEHIAASLSISRQTVKEHMSLAMKAIVAHIKEEHGVIVQLKPLGRVSG